MSPVLATSVGDIGPLELVLLLLLLWLVFTLFRRIGGRLTSRPCPRCGRRIQAGELECDSCGFDFRSIGASTP
jgi:hypothetical protein